MRCKVFFITLFLALITTLTAFAEVKQKTVSSAEVVAWPSNNIVHKGETVDLKGLKVKVTFEDGEDYIAGADDFTVDSFDSNTEGSQLVTIRYGTYPVTIAVMVKEGSVVRLGVEVESKQRYVGDPFDKTDLRVIGYYDTGYIRDVTDYTIDKEVLAEESNTVTVTYLGVTSTFTVSASKNDCVSLTTKSSGTIQYKVGDTFTAKDIKVIAKLRRGEEVDVTSKCEFIAPDMSREGVATVRVEYDNVSTTYQIQLIKYVLDHVDVSEYDEKKVVYLYFVGIEKPVTVKQGIVTTNDYTTNMRQYTIIWGNDTYTAESELPDDEKRYVGTQKIRVQVPIAVHVISDKYGELGYIPQHDVQNVSTVHVSMNIKLKSQYEFLHGFPLMIDIPANERKTFSLNIDNIKEYDTQTDFRTGVLVILGVNDA